MAKTLIGNIKGKDGRGISSIINTGTTGSVDTYTIKYTDGTTSTYTVNNSDSVSLQRQIVPSAAVESSATASQAYAAGDYVVVGGVLRKVKSAISKGGTISDSNSTATTVTGELATVGDSVSPITVLYNEGGWYVAYKTGAVYVQANGITTSSDSWATITCPYTIPPQYRPRVRVNVAAITSNGGSWTGIMLIDEDGKILVKNMGANGSTDARYAAASWPV